jgi:nicotinate phosphoribosyltransferase
VPNAIRVFKEMREEGIVLQDYGIRLDSGDLAYISKMSRKLLDEAGFADAIISASGDLDENLITQLKIQGAKINLWGVGTNLITSEDCPAFGGVYKLAAQMNSEGKMIPRIKLSENPNKVTNPGDKKAFRLYDSQNGKFKADLITLVDECVDESKDLTLFDPISTWKSMTLEAGAYSVRELLEPVYVEGECVFEKRSIPEIQGYCRREMETLWDEHKRLVRPQLAYVDLSQRLYNLKQEMIREMRGISR